MLHFSFYVGVVGDGIVTVHDHDGETVVTVTDGSLEFTVIKSIRLSHESLYPITVYSSFEVPFGDRDTDLERAIGGTFDKHVASSEWIGSHGLPFLI